MPRWRVLSGAEVLRILGSFGFVEVGRRGSHVKAVRTSSGRRQVLTVPDHRELDRGTLHAIYRQALRYIPEAELRRHFVAD